MACDTRYCKDCGATYIVSPKTPYERFGWTPPSKLRECVESGLLTPELARKIYRDERGLPPETPEHLPNLDWCKTKIGEPRRRLWHRFQDWVDRLADRRKASDRWYW